MKDNDGVNMTTYAVKAHPTMYCGVQFRSRLEARWAAFFNLMCWEWSYEPIDLKGWVPDFYVSFWCLAGGCQERHQLYIEVKPYRTIEEFLGHPVASLDPYGTPSPAMFGLGPEVTEWQARHRHGDSIYSVGCWGEQADTVYEVWKEAGNLVQWKAR